MIEIVMYTVKTLVTTQNNSKENIKEVGKTVLNMPQPTTQSKGEDLLSFKMGTSTKGDVAKFSFGYKFAFNEDKGIVQSFRASAEVVETYGVDLETDIYQNDEGTGVVETELSHGPTEPSKPSLPVDINPDAINRTVFRFIEAIQNYVDQKIDETINPEKYLEINTNDE